MAPETLDGGEATKDSDYFSFGVLAYLMLSGRHPYFADDPSCLTSEDDNIRSLTFRVPPLSTLRSDIPQKVADLVMELLSRDAKVRARAEQDLKAALSEKFEPEVTSAVSTRGEG
jgi:serine/threonine-protein kinase